MLERFIATMPLAKLATHLDIANTARRLALDEVEFRTGAGSDVGGGCFIS